MPSCMGRLGSLGAPPRNMAAVLQQAGVQAYEQRQRAEARAEDPECKQICRMAGSLLLHILMFGAKQGRSCFQGLT